VVALHGEGKPINPSISTSAKRAQTNRRLDTTGEAEIYTQQGDGPKAELLHRDADGVWS
jgi:hypothetical protein